MTLVLTGTVAVDGVNTKAPPVPTVTVIEPAKEGMAVKKAATPAVKPISPNKFLVDFMV